MPVLLLFCPLEALSYLMDSMRENTYYEIVDTLQICLLFFRFADQLLSVFHIQNTITACINAFTGNSIEFSYHRLHGFQEKIDAKPLFETESLDYDELYRRYDGENHFLKMIETGNTKAVMTAYSEMTMSPKSPHKMIDTAIYQNPVISLSIVRALARKAAENGGASIVDINEITQRTVQKITSSQDYPDHLNFTLSMIYELTEAVHKHQLHFGAYSAPIQKILEYLDLNYSQKISFPHLAEMVHFSEAYLSKIFKKEVGVTITQYIMHIRCKKAAQLLKDTNLSVQEISSYGGYPDNNYFVKVFKNQYGVTPTDFRSGH